MTEFDDDGDLIPTPEAIAWAKQDSPNLSEEEQYAMALLKTVIDDIEETAKAQAEFIKELME